MHTFSIHTLGCRVNHSEAEQMAALLRQRGMVPAGDAASADLRIVHTCSVTAEAAAKSRQAVRRASRAGAGIADGGGRLSLPILGQHIPPAAGNDVKTLVTGCWATSNPADAAAIDGVTDAIGHRECLADRLNRLLDEHGVGAAPRPGAVTLPLLGEERSAHQRAFVKVQDGCDAFCTYCIIPQLRLVLWSKPVADCVEEVRRLVAAGHHEVVLTGIFLGAYGHGTALRRKQGNEGARLATLVDAICRGVPRLRRLRLSSLEPGDMTDGLLAVLKSHRQVVPHFHLPLQSGSDAILRRMNRQYRRDDFLRMVDRVDEAFDRPAITTDIIVGFPGETDAEFAETLDVVDRVRFIHTHAFPYSPRPGTAAARWTQNRVAHRIASARVEVLRRRAEAHAEAFGRQFVGEVVEILVERPKHATVRRGRCERYFEVEVDDARLRAGDAVDVRVTAVAGRRALGEVVGRPA